MNRSTFFKLVLITCLPLIIPLFFAGCKSELRFAPDESLKQNAALNRAANEDIFLNGTDPGSKISKVALDASINTQTYIGEPQEAFKDIDTVLANAQTKAAERPDAWELINNGLGLAVTIGTVVLGGGGATYGGAKLIGAMKELQRKSTAIREIVRAQEVFKSELKIAADSDETFKAADALAALKQANDGIQTTPTQILVTETKDPREETYA